MVPSCGRAGLAGYGDPSPLWECDFDWIGSRLDGRRPYHGSLITLHNVTGRIEVEITESKSARPLCKFNGPYIWSARLRTYYTCVLEDEIERPKGARLPEEAIARIAMSMRQVSIIRKTLKALHEQASFSSGNDSWFDRDAFRPSSGLLLCL